MWWKSRRHGNIPYDRIYNINRAAILFNQEEHMPKELFVCPVCGYDGLRWKPYYEGGKAPSGEICPCCGFEYGYDDDALDETHEGYRKKWIDNGAQWWSTPQCKPDGWSLETQLKNIEKYIEWSDIPLNLPKFETLQADYISDRKGVGKVVGLFSYEGDEISKLKITAILFDENGIPVGSFKGYKDDVAVGDNLFELDMGNTHSDDVKSIHLRFERQ